MSTSRRDFFARMFAGAIPLAVGLQQQQPRPGRPPADTSGTAGDTLYNPAGRASAPVGPYDNDPGIIAIERKLRCTCGCTLDVYTCRTTDFSCTYSPAMHKDVITAVQSGATPDQVLGAFVTRYGESVLMSPPTSGFSLAGYLIPGLTVTAVGLILVAWLLRKRTTPELAAPAGTPAAAPADPEQLERLRRALDQVDA